MTTKKLTVDEEVKELFDIVQARKLEIEKLEKPCWNTSTEFGFSANSLHDRVNVATVTDTRKIVDMLSFLLDRKDKTERAANELGVEYEFKWLGFTLDEWKEDFKTRVGQIKIKEKQKELQELEAQLDTIISPELKRQMKLEEIKKALGK